MVICNDKINTLFCGLSDGVAENAIFNFLIKFYFLSNFFKVVNHGRIGV